MWETNAKKKDLLKWIKHKLFTSKKMWMDTIEVENTKV